MYICGKKYIFLVRGCLKTKETTLDLTYVALKYVPSPCSSSMLHCLIVLIHESFLVSLLASPLFSQADKARHIR